MLMLGTNKKRRKKSVDSKKMNGFHSLMEKQRMDGITIMEVK